MGEWPPSVWGTLHNTPYKDGFPNDLETKDGLKLLLKAYFDDFRHADGTLDFQRFRASLRPAGCAIAGSRVSLSLAAAQRVVRFTPDCEVGEWWWFENSRAYLYYFFIVNDCQFIVRSLRVAGRP